MFTYLLITSFFSLIMWPLSVLLVTALATLTTSQTTPFARTGSGNTSLTWTPSVQARTKISPLSSLPRSQSSAYLNVAVRCDCPPWFPNDTWWGNYNWQDSDPDKPPECKEGDEETRPLEYGTEVKTKYCCSSASVYPYEIFFCLDYVHLPRWFRVRDS